MVNEILLSFEAATPSTTETRMYFLCIERAKLFDMKPINKNVDDAIEKHHVAEYNVKLLRDYLET